MRIVVDAHIPSELFKGLTDRAPDPPEAPVTRTDAGGSFGDGMVLNDARRAAQRQAIERMEEADTDKPISLVNGPITNSRVGL